MKLKNYPADEAAENAFKCSTCGVVYMTKDHVPIEGESSAND